MRSANRYRQKNYRVAFLALALAAASAATAALLVHNRDANSPQAGPHEQEPPKYRVHNAE
jgi:hypothetical protein